MELRIVQVKTLKAGGSSLNPEQIPENKQKLEIIFTGKDGFLKQKVVKQIYGDPRDWIQGALYHVEDPTFVEFPADIPEDYEGPMDQFLKKQN